MCDLQDMLNRINIEKKKCGYTNKTLSDATGIPKSTLDKVLAGIIKEPPVTSIIKIAKVLNVSTDYLIYGSKNSSNISSILNKYNSLNPLGKTKAFSYIDDLCEQDKYTINVNTNNFGEIAAWGADGTEGTFETPEEEIT